MKPILRHGDKYAVLTPNGIECFEFIGNAKRMSLISAGKRKDRSG